MTFLDNVKAAKSMWDASPTDSVAALEKLTPSSSLDAVNYWRTYIVHKEWHERMVRGLMPYHSHDISDMGFRFVDLEPWGKAAKASGSMMDIGLYLFCKGERVSCEKLLRLFERNGHVAASVRFDAEFHEALGKDGEFAELPAVDLHNDVALPGPVVWLACDGNYLPFALPMIRSLRAVAPEVACHLHVFNPPEGYEALMPGVGISYEVCPAHKGYYHAVRFIRLWQFQQRINRPVWLMDVDALFHNHPKPLFDTLDGYDVALRARPARLEPWNQLNACVVGFNAESDYLKKIANYIYGLRHYLAWGIDQTAMLCVFEHLKPKVFCLGERFVDYDYRADGIVWCNSSNKKWVHLQALTDASKVVERPVYFERFKLFAHST